MYLIQAVQQVVVSLNFYTVKAFLNIKILYLSDQEILKLWLL